MTADAYVNYAVIVSGSFWVAGTSRTYKNPAGPSHLDALFDEYAFIRLGYAVRRHPRGRAARGRAGGWIFAVVKQHPGM